MRNYLRAIMMLFTISISVVVSRAQTCSAQFSSETDTFNGVTLNYRKAITNPSGKGQPITILYLHGGSAQGSDNQAQLNSQAIEDIYNYLNSNGYTATILAPQAPDGHQWDGELLPWLKSLLDKYSNNGKSKLYALGGSMGGYGVWNLMSAYPGYLKGAMPVACNTPRESADRYLPTKIYSVVGGKDFRRDIDSIQEFFSLFESKGGQGKVDVEKEWNHHDTCEFSFSKERLGWLFNDINSSVKDLTHDVNSTQNTIYDLSGKRITNISKGDIYIVSNKKSIYLY